MAAMKAEIQRILSEIFNPRYLEVIDESPMHACHKHSGCQYKVIISSEKFNGKTELNRVAWLMMRLKPSKMKFMLCQ